MRSRHWQGRQSRCCVPQDPPLNWVDSIDYQHESVISLSDWIEGLSRYAQLDVVARLESLTTKAANGELVVGEEQIEPIVSDPAMYELRWTLLSKIVRQYHAEPEKYPEHLVKLHIHIKADATRQVASERSQQQEIDTAIDRYHGT